MVTSTACLNAATSICPLALTYFIKFSEARLQAVSSKNMYSEQGLLALIRAVFFDVCQRLTVVSYCIPGSPQCQVESEIFSIKSSVTRTEWLAFWKKIEAYASPSIELS